METKPVLKNKGADQEAEMEIGGSVFAGFATGLGFALAFALIAFIISLVRRNGTQQLSRGCTPCFQGQFKRRSAVFGRRR